MYRKNKNQKAKARRVKNVLNAVYCPYCGRISYIWKNGYRCYMCGFIEEINLSSEYHPNLAKAE